jgi:hypothetical protein
VDDLLFCGPGPTKALVVFEYLFAWSIVVLFVIDKRVQLLVTLVHTIGTIIHLSKCANAYSTCTNVPNSTSRFAHIDMDINPCSGSEYLSFKCINAE